MTVTVPTSDEFAALSDQVAALQPASIQALTDRVTAIEAQLPGFATSAQLSDALSGLATTTALDAAVADLVTTSQLSASVSGLATTTQVNDAVAGLVTTTQLNNAVSGLVTTSQLNTAIAGVSGGTLNLTQYATPANSELISSLNVYASNPVITQIFSVDLQSVLSAKGKTLAVGDYVQFDYEFQVTNNNTNASYNVGVAKQALAASTATAVTGTVIEPANGMNVTPAMHHATYGGNGSFIVTDATAQRYLNINVWAVSSWSTLAMTVDRGYGRVYVTVIKNYA